MENVTYTEENQRRIEKFLMVIFSVYNLAMVMMSVSQEWNRWIGIFMLLGLASCWMMLSGKYRNYLFRAKYTTIIMQINIVLYATQVEEISRILPIFIVSVVLLGLYGVADIIRLTVVSAVCIYIYHGLVAGSIPRSTMEECVSALLQLGNIFLLQYVVYLWTKRNSEGSAQLLGAIEELKAVESSKDDFLANVSHEIRTPINTICGMSELVLREELPQNIKDNVMNIQIAGRNLMSVVRDILDFSELQSGNMELEEEAYNITSTINDVINMTLARKNEKNIELVVDCDANIPCALLGDEKKLRRVIMNLLDNAIKFTEEGYVSIIIGYRKEEYGINLVITVKDTGIGMEEESLEKLFTSFNQVDASRKRQEGGVGLGLAISQALVQKMGGAITVKSTLGKGSVVKFVIPQKVLDAAPIAAISDRQNVNVATYIDMEQFATAAMRDEYSKCIVHMVEQLKGKCHVCRNLAELQRRQEKESFSHIFISIPEYRENPAYFDKLAELTKVIVVLDRQNEKYIANTKLLKIYKPFYILTIVSVLNGLYDEQNKKCPVSTEKFVTRDAHVLVVDDNRMNIRVIEGLLSNYRIKVTMAISGKEALDKIASMDYDFVFMDHMMPEMDGVETMHRIRHKVGSYYQKVPIIALTANAVAGTREMFLAEGFNDFLEKPIERSVLERVLKRNLPAEKIVSMDDYDTVLSAESMEESTGEVLASAVGDTIQGHSVGNHREKVKHDRGEKSGNKAADVDDDIAVLERELGIEGLDVRKGVIYCNGKQQYISVLQGFCEDCDELEVRAEQLFEKQDWKNYTIEVHGIKGAMNSIGALKLSELAKQLEYAGKEGRIEYILEHHDDMMEEYRRIFSSLRKNERICPPVEAEEEQENEQLLLEDDIFEQRIAEMEEAMYSLDGDRLMEIMSELQRYQYRGISLKALMVPVKRKVEMSDYVSAVEMVIRLKNQLVTKGGNV